MSHRKGGISGPLWSRQRYVAGQGDQYLDTVSRRTESLTQAAETRGLDGLSSQARSLSRASLINSIYPPTQGMLFLLFNQRAAVLVTEQA